MPPPATSAFGGEEEERRKARVRPAGRPVDGQLSAGRPAGAVSPSAGRRGGGSGCWPRSIQGEMARRMTVGSAVAYLIQPNYVPRSFRRRVMMIGVVS